MSTRRMPDRYWHVAVTKKAAKPENVIENDLTFVDLERRIVRPWHERRGFVVSGKVFRSRDEVDSIRVTCTEEPKAFHAKKSEAAWERQQAENAENGIILVGGGFDGRYWALHAGEDYTSELLFETSVEPVPSKGGESIEAQVTTKARAILFLDVVGWSKLTASEIRTFIEKALPTLGAIVRKRSPAMVNTWGDAIVAVFDSAVDSAETALDLCDHFQRAKASDGVVKNMSARVGLHFGEVFWTTNPITGNRDVFGPAVHTAARLEPVAAAGHAFCTVDFARMLDGVAEEAPRAHPIGTMPLAKGFGTQELYVVTWRNAPAPSPERFRVPENYNELATLQRRLEDQQVGGGSLWHFLQNAAKAAPIQSPQELVAGLTAAGCNDPEEPFWWLIVYGVLEYDNILKWWDTKKDSATSSVGYTRISPRGRALLDGLRR